MLLVCVCVCVCVCVNFCVTVCMIDGVRNGASVRMCVVLVAAVCIVYLFFSLFLQTFLRIPSCNCHIGNNWEILYTGNIPGNLRVYMWAVPNCNKVSHRLIIIIIIIIIIITVHLTNPLGSSSLLKFTWITAKYKISRSKNVMYKIYLIYLS